MKVCVFQDHRYFAAGTYPEEVGVHPAAAFLLAAEAPIAERRSSAAKAAVGACAGCARQRGLPRFCP